jgi:hypothetical protein
MGSDFCPHLAVAKDAHRRAAGGLPSPDGYLDPVELRHPDVEDEEIGLMLLRELHGLEAVGGFGHNAVSRLFQQTSQPAADDAVVDTHQDPQATPLNQR